MKFTSETADLSLGHFIWYLFHKKCEVLLFPTWRKIICLYNLLIDLECSILKFHSYSNSASGKSKRKIKNIAFQIDKLVYVFAIIDKCGRNRITRFRTFTVCKAKICEVTGEIKKSVFILSAPLHECKDDKDCDSRAKCVEEKCICQGNTTGNGKYCRGNCQPCYTCNIFHNYVPLVSE